MTLAPTSLASFAPPLFSNRLFSNRLFSNRPIGRKATVAEANVAAAASKSGRRMFRLVLFLTSGAMTAFAFGLSAKASGTRTW